MSRYSNIKTSLAMSTLATWSRVVRSRDVRSRVFSRPINSTDSSTSPTKKTLMTCSKHHTLFTNYNKFIKLQHFIVVFVDVSATAAVFVETTVHQVSLPRTVSSHRCVEVGRTPRLGSSTSYSFSNRTETRPETSTTQSVYTGGEN